MTTYQMPLFDAPKPIIPCDPSVSKEDVPRLTGQNKEILNALKEGPKSNRELAQIALKYTSRNSDLRDAGCVIEASKKNRGLVIYTLKHVPAGL